MTEEKEELLLETSLLWSRTKAPDMDRVILVIPDQAEDVDQHQGDDDDGRGPVHPVHGDVLFPGQPVHHQDVHDVIEDVETDIARSKDQTRVAPWVMNGSAGQGIGDGPQHGAHLLGFILVVLIIIVSNISAFRFTFLTSLSPEYKSS